MGPNLMRRSLVLGGLVAGRGKLACGWLFGLFTNGMDRTSRACLIFVLVSLEHTGGMRDDTRSSKGYATSK